MWYLHVRENVTENGVHRGSNNLTREQAEGKREIQRGIKDKGGMLYGTDKSGKLVLDQQVNFLKAMEPHYLGHVEV